MVESRHLKDTYRNNLIAKAQPNNSFNPTLASESSTIKLSGFWYLACIALASGGLIRALGGFQCIKSEEMSFTLHEEAEWNAT
jgi:hypothetical protein